MPPRFLYFDLGRVILNFDVSRMCRQMGQVAGMDATDVMKVIFESQLQNQYERGQVSTPEFYEAFCTATGARPDFNALSWAANDIFELNTSIVPAIAQLQQAGYRTGILSNTCDGHWEHCRRRFRILDDFDVYALSYRIGAAKPQKEIFQAAAELAGVAPEEIFFTDDIEGHVLGARSVGYDAVVYTATPSLVDELRRRGLRFNY